MLKDNITTLLYTLGDDLMNNMIKNREKREPKSTDEIRRIINHYAIADVKDLQIDVMFVKKKKSGREIQYETYMFQCSNDSIEPAVKGTLKRVNGILNNRKLDKYDLEISIDDTIQTIEKEQVIHGDALLNEITIVLTDDNTLNDKFDFDKLDFLIMQISSRKKKKDMPKVTFLKKHLRPSSKFKNSVKGFINGKEFKPLPQKIITIGDNIDAFLIDGFYYITNRNNFNSMLEFKDVYYKIIEDNKKDIMSARIFDNSKQFIEDCQNDGRFLPRFTKAILADGFKNAKVYNNNLAEIIEKHKLKLRLTPKGQIEYDNKYINEMLNLLLQHYVTSDLTKKSMIAKAIEKYS